jgi:peptidoglycan/xylan/chitin deacetylase (PgdA/CDA1 family)
MVLVTLLAGLSVLTGAVVSGLRSGTTKIRASVPIVATQAHVHRRSARVRVVAGAVSRRQAVPILMYHVVAGAPAGAPFPGLYVTPHDFAAQIDGLARAGFHGVTLDQVRAAWRGVGRLPKRAVVVTFDNGYRSQYSEALPVLRRVGWVADENLQLQGLPPTEGGLTVHEVRGLVAAGWELDTQGWSHADLTTLQPRQLRYQVAFARRRIRSLYGVRADWFCYPSGRYNPTVIAAVRAAGYMGATTVVPGWARADDDPFTLPRLRVLAGTSPSALLAQISGNRSDPVPPGSYLSAA